MREVAMDANQIIEVCEANWDAHKSDCSGFVKAVVAALGLSTFVPSDDANTIVSKLSTATDWAAITPGDGLEAKAQADAGLLVIAGLKGSDQVNQEPHGHVVVVVTGPLDSGHSKYPTAYWGKLGGVGAKAETINWAWRAVDRDNVSYFAKSLDTPTSAPESAGASDDEPST
jgi:hypothetical protein